MPQQRLTGFQNHLKVTQTGHKCALGHGQGHIHLDIRLGSRLLHHFLDITQESGIAGRYVRGNLSRKACNVEEHVGANIPEFVNRQQLSPIRQGKKEFR